MRGDFRMAARLAESMRTDDAIFVARANRIAPQRCVKREIIPVPSARGSSVASEAAALFGQTGVGLHPDTIADIHGCLVDHGVAFACLSAEPREDGSRVDLTVNYWPIEHVRWDPNLRSYVTRVDPGSSDEGWEVPITHGDGRWVVFAKAEVEAFKHGTLLPAALVWARHAFALRDWSRGSNAHGSAKIVGELPESVPLQDANGALTPEAAAMLELLRDYAQGDSPVGIRPAGSKTEFVALTSGAWQVWNELVTNAERAAARIYLGTDGTLGATGGAPGVDISALFGVASTIVQGDLECLERGLNTGAIEPWCAMNFGTSALAPRLRYVVPDPDLDAARESMKVRRTAFYKDIAYAYSVGFAITQEFVDERAAAHGITAPTLSGTLPPLPGQFWSLA